MKLKVMTIVGTRPEIIRLSECIKTLDKHFEHILVHTGQNYDYELNNIFFKQLDLREPDFFLNCASENLGETIGNIITNSYDVISKSAPDALLILGDTNSALCAISAKRLKVPIFHMEAGNRCFDENVPEEINRRIVDHISDVNLPYTEHSRRYLVDEGIKTARVFVTGSPMREVIEKNKEKIIQNNVLKTIGVEKQNYIIVSAHREENVDNVQNFNRLVKTIDAIADHFDMPIIFSTHPRTKKRIQAQNIVFNKKVQTFKPFGFFEYACLQKNAFCTLSDSGTLSEEAAMLNFPAVLLRTSTERNEAVDSGNIVICALEKTMIVQSVNLARETTQTLPKDYCEKNVSAKVAKIIQSYTGIVNSVVWKKQL